MSDKNMTIKALIIEILKNKITERLCSSYYSTLSEFEESDNQKLLKAVLSYHMKPSEAQKPFDAFLILDGRRSSAPEDLSENEIRKLVESYKEIDDPELKARFADVLWIKKREINYAHDAITAYIKSAKNLRNKSWTYSRDRIERALKLSLSLGKGGEHYMKNVTSYIREILEKYDLKEEAYFPLKLTELLLEVEYKDDIFCISILEKCIKFFSKEKDIRRLNDYLEALAQWHEKNNEAGKAKENRKQIAENYVESQSLESSAMGKARCLQNAIEVYRRVGNNKKRIDELHKELIKVQKNIPSEMHTYSGENIDISASVEVSIKHVSNISKREALIRFCFIVKPTDIKHTFDFVEKQAQQFIHTSLFGRTTVNKDGKTIGYFTGLTNNELPREELIYPHLVDHMGLIWGLNVQGSIIPAKEQIILEHQIEESDLKEFIGNNPLIRNGHEALFAQGILFGFEGKWDLSLGILAIQIEDSLRYLLEKKGVLTSNIKSDFTQEERGATYFFKNYSKELKEIFGEDIFYELKVLLIKDDNGNGFNLRNLIAHGLMSQNEFYSGTCVYFWWLVLRLICTPLVIDENKKEK